MGSEQSTQTNSSASGKGTGHGVNQKSCSYLYPIGSHENLSKSTVKDTEESGIGSKQLAYNRLDLKVNDDSNMTETTTLQAQLQAKVSAHVVSGVATASQKLDAASALINRQNTSKPSMADAIIVVNSGKPFKEEILEDDPIMQQMKDISVCLPLLKGTSSLSNEKSKSRSAVSTVQTLRIDFKEAMILGIRYQDHLKRCAEAVAFDQNSLCTRVKEIDFAVNTLMSMLTERQKKYAKLAEQISKTNEILQSVRSIHNSIASMVPLLNDMNQELPPQLRLAPVNSSLTKSDSDLHSETGLANFEKSLVDLETCCSPKDL